MLNQKGIIKLLPLLLIIAAVGIISFLFISSTLPFKNNFDTRYPKKTSHASSNLSLGNGVDNAVTFAASTNINMINKISGRSCSDGGDAVNYSVVALASSSATLAYTPSSGCLNTNDEVLLINLQGTKSSFTNVGNYETLIIQSVSGNNVTFSTQKTKFYGAALNDDSNIATASASQRVMLQRVPNYTDVTVNPNVVVSPSAWNGVKGGILFFRANGNVIINGSLNTSGLGFKGGTGAPNGGCAGCANGMGGESTGGLGVITTTAFNSEGGGGGGKAWNGPNSYSKGGGGAGGSYGQQGSDGSSGDSVGGTAGPTYGEATLMQQLKFGSGGGGGGGGILTSDRGGDGGSGGGIIMLGVNNLQITGSIVNDGTSGISGVDRGAGGGGGSGGSILISTSGNTTLGNLLVTSKGSNGGCCGLAGAPGGNGAVGRIAIYALNTINGTTNPPAFAGNPCPKAPLGDIDCNGKIDIFDYNILVTNFNKTVPPNSQGDLDGDGKIGIFDYNILVTNFNT